MTLSLKMLGHFLIKSVKIKVIHVEVYQDEGVFEMVCEGGGNVFLVIISSSYLD